MLNHMGTRRTARVIAFQTLYRYDFTGESIHHLMEFSWLGEEKLESTKKDALLFARLLIRGTLDNLKEIDDTIAGALNRKNIKRLAKIDLAILRISVYGLLFMKDVPAKVTIDEGINISKNFGANASYRFINGVLDNINKKRIGKDKIPVEE